MCKMKIIQEADKKVIELLNEKFVDNIDLSEGYKISQYCKELVVENIICVYNTLTCQMVEISTYEKEEFYNSDFAKENYFSFPETVSEKDLSTYVRNCIKIKREGVCKYTIYTTTNCNARCFYCFEKGTNMINMTTETADDVIKYIDRTSGNQPLELSWFGGEPMVNTKVIDYICDYYKENNRDFYSTMVTNAYLLNEDNVNRALDKWNLKWVLITVDGYKEDYNKIKAYANGDEDSFSVVMDNINYMLDKGIEVVITVRANGSNEESIMHLIDYLADRFPSYSNLKVNCQLIHVKSAGKYIEDAENLDKKMNVAQKNILNKLYESGLFNYTVPKNFKVFQCDSVSGKASNIHPDGKIACCLCYMEEANIGDVNNEMINNDIIKQFEELYDEEKHCEKCMFLPQCIKLLKCDNAGPWCSEERRNSMNTRVELQMRNTFALFESKEK